MRVPIRLRKIVRDVRLTAGRVVIMIVAIAVAVTGFGAILVAREVITHDAAVAYRSSNPAAATLDVPAGVDADLLERVRGIDGVDDATARQTVMTRVRVDGTWLPLRLFVVSDDDPLRIARITMEQGTWPPAFGGIVLERAALVLLGVAPGETLEVARGVDGADGSGSSDGSDRAPNETSMVEVSGSAWDPAMPPATQERTGYAFVTPAIVRELGFAVVADQLAITVDDGAGQPTRDQARVDAVAADVAQWLESAGFAVHSVTAPPFRHPHQNQTETVTSLLVACALAGLVLATVLVSSTLGGMLAAQSRQIGVMKTLGATTATIVRLYLAMTLAISAVATAIALWPAVTAGLGLADLVGGILNVDIVTRSPSVLTIALTVAAGVAITGAVAIVPILRAARTTVLAAIEGAEVDRRVGSRPIDRLLARAGGGDRTIVFAARNLLRRPRRFIATVALLSLGGALFVAGVNSAGAWQKWVDDGLSKRSYDAQLFFAAPHFLDEVTTALATAPGVASWDVIAAMPVTPSSSSGQALVERVYPDGGHGAFTATAIDPETPTIAFDARAGRWLRADDTGVVVLNQSAAARMGHPAIGDAIALSAEGTVIEARLVGVVDEVGGGANAYLPTGALDGALGSPGLVTAVRVLTSTSPATPAGLEAVERELAERGIVVQSTVPTAELKTAIDQHVVIFIAVLITLAIMMAVIGTLGLASALTVSIAERTREHGVLKAIGARPSFIRALVVTEGVLTGVVALAVALVVAVPLSTVVESTLGTLAFDLPLPAFISLPGIVGWAVVSVVVAATASLSAAVRASRLSVRESLVTL
jgi:putative ABC transport system permease protein